MSVLRSSARATVGTVVPAPRGRITRAAVFSAALAACSDKTADSPTPAPPPAQGSDDLEKLLDVEPSVVERPAPPDAASPDAASAVASAGDAGVPVDAGIDPAIAERKRREAAKRKLREQQLREQRERELRAIPDPDFRHLPTPYGAPPARHRVV